MCKLAKCIAMFYGQQVGQPGWTPVAENLANCNDMRVKTMDNRLQPSWVSEDTFGHGCLIDDAAIKHTASDAVMSTNGH